MSKRNLSAIRTLQRTKRRAPRTVELHVRHVLSKLDCRSRTEATSKAHELVLTRNHCDALNQATAAMAPGRSATHSRNGSRRSHLSARCDRPLLSTWTAKWVNRRSTRRRESTPDDPR